MTLFLMESSNHPFNTLIIFHGLTAAYMLSCHTENDAQKYGNYCGPSISCMKFIKEMNMSTIREASHSNKDKPYHSSQSPG